MKLRDYIEKRAATKRQLRLADKYMAESDEANMARRSFNKKSNPFSARDVKDIQGRLALGRVARAVEKKHRHGRGAARAYAMGDTRMGDMMRAYGEAEEHRRQNLMRKLRPSKHGSLQRKARKAFGKIIK